MARAKTSGRSRRKKGGMGRWMFRLVALLALVGIVFVAWFWWDMREWRPDEALYPEQGAVIPSEINGINFNTLKAVGGQFAYLELQPASRALDDDFGSRFEQARRSGIDIGIVLQFDPCLRAGLQSKRFTRMVPRSEALLPPAIELDASGKDCAEPVSDAAVESELLTLINQIEMHSGKPVILKLNRDFEAQYGTAQTMGRDLWLMRDRARPDYAGRPWLLWSANSQLVSEASDEPIEWVVVQR
ncbi:glycoside hydrolase family 25 protein [Erythrobacter sp. F6033]|uniref:glycoside hydrolase family 25 protein n=1 Tax=Erythrobacter sp. F6033 TaxID=2926401 RepID=UPI001FF1D93D|nr:glycoside hydrolase family 25 protein [Erythrobacter sp. F6033]MCK0127221.1 glycoside hydrolase family 25 protein [Erythrobacter sp. F6033]